MLSCPWTHAFALAPSSVRFTACWMPPAVQNEDASGRASRGGQHALSANGGDGSNLCRDAIDAPDKTLCHGVAGLQNMSSPSSPGDISSIRCEEDIQAQSSSSEDEEDRGSETSASVITRRQPRESTLSNTQERTTQAAYMGTEVLVPVRSRKPSRRLQEAVEDHQVIVRLSRVLLSHAFLAISSSALSHTLIFALDDQI